MDLKVSIIILVLLLVNHQNCNGVEAKRIITKEEELEIEEQLKILNKQPIKSIQSEAGDIFDCIDINKQPTLDHPLLKDHKVQMQPTFLAKGTFDETMPQTRKSRIASVDCPKGTVPIRRIRKEDLIRAKRFTKEFSTNMGTLVSFPGQSRAIVRSVLKLDGGMTGALGTMNVMNPIKVENDQFSKSLIWVEKGTMEGEYGTIHAGWAVAPELYGDTKTRFITYWASYSKGKQDGGCYNTLCKGFVQVDNKYPINTVLTDISKYDENAYDMKVGIIQDNATKNWWLTVPSTSSKIGYWPNQILPHLNNGTNSIGWGGLTKASASGISPPMGFSTFPDGNTLHSGYFIQCKVLNELGVEVKPYITGVTLDNEDCYKLLDGKDITDDYAHAFAYGGPGGKCT